MSFTKSLLLFLLTLTNGSAIAEKQDPSLMIGPLSVKYPADCDEEYFFFSQGGATFFSKDGAEHSFQFQTGFNLVKPDGTEFFVGVSSSEKKGSATSFQLVPKKDIPDSYSVSTIYQMDFFFVQEPISYSNVTKVLDGQPYKTVLLFDCPTQKFVS